MLWLFFPPVTCTNSVTNPLVTILAILDLIFLLYVAHSDTEGLKQHISFILLSHGTVLALIQVCRIPPLIFIVVPIVYFQLCNNDIIIRIISILNCCVLNTIIKNGILRTGIFNPFFCLRMMVILCGIYVALGIFRINLLLKIHTILVCYIIISYMLSSFFNIYLLNQVQVNQRGNLIQLFVSFFILSGLFYIEFIF